MRIVFSGRALMCLGLILLGTSVANAQYKKAKVRSAVSPVSTIAREMLSVHNGIRADRKLPPLQWSDTLAVYSQKWANALLKSNRAAHNPNSPYGENILVSGIGSTPSSIVNEWASESRDYSYQTNACSTDCGHYTQIVWRHTSRVGCAVARGVQREIWVCSYDPPGNYRDEWPY
jgi:pathogenesis-related protein 1